jgi:hypothetical protein
VGPRVGEKVVGFDTHDEPNPVFIPKGGNSRKGLQFFEEF